MSKRRRQRHMYPRPLYEKAVHRLV